MFKPTELIQLEKQLKQSDKLLHYTFVKWLRKNPITMDKLALMTLISHQLYKYVCCPVSEQIWKNLFSFQFFLIIKFYLKVHK